MKTSKAQEDPSKFQEGRHRRKWAVQEASRIIRSQTYFSHNSLGEKMKVISWKRQGSSENYSWVSGRVCCCPKGTSRRCMRLPPNVLTYPILLRTDAECRLKPEEKQNMYIHR
ncbi:hypothetical protein Trydic_g11727 [Trypoxylus dichotomus]